MWAMLIIATLLWLDRASRTYCASCYRPFAVFLAKGQRHAWVSQCRRCYRVHRIRRRAEARR